MPKSVVPAKWLRLRKAFGVVLIERRKELGLRQVDLEEVVDGRIDRSYISRLERGDREPSLGAIFDIAEALQMTPGELLNAVAERIEDK
jgi:transcriptional regulator with XRE-family HTH domain